MTELEKRAARMKWDPPPPGSKERKEVPKTAFLSPSSKTFPYKVLIDGEWVISEKGLRSAISVANFRGNSVISARASKLLEELLSDEVAHKNNSLQHFETLGMKWGVREQEAAERKDIKWVGKHSAKIQTKARKAISKELDSYVHNELNKTLSPKLKSGKVSKEYLAAYNQKLASLMNKQVNDIIVPSGRIIQFVAKRGELGVFTALADKGYDMGQLKRGIHTSGKVAYKKDVIRRVGGGNQ